MIGTAPARRPRPLLAITNFWPPMAGGTGYALRGMIRNLDDVVVLAPRVPGLEAGGSCRVVPRLRFSGRAGGPLKVFSALQHLEIVLTPLLWCGRPGRPRPRLLVCVQPLFCGVGGLLTKWALGIPFVTLVHGEELTTVQQPRSPMRLRHRVLRRTLRAAAAVICNSENTRRLVARYYEIDPDKVHVIHPAIDTAGPRPAAGPDAHAFRRRLVGSDRLVLMVGRLAQVHKGFDTAIRALPAVLRQAPDTSLVIAGPGDPGPLTELARSLDVAHKVKFVGQVSQADLGLLFAICDLFLLPGREVRGTAEGFGVVFLEAALAGKAAVGGRSGGVAEAVLDGETGLLVDGESPADVAEGVIRLLADPALAKCLGTRARERVLREFDGRWQQRSFAAVVDAVLAGGRSRW